MCERTKNELISYKFHTVVPEVSFFVCNPVQRRILLLFWIRERRKHRLINNTDRKIDVVFSRLNGFSFTIILRQKPEGVPRRQRWITRQRESMRVTLLGLCLRVIVNEKLLNLEKTTSSVLSVLLINLWV